jgi:plastocyanin
VVAVEGRREARTAWGWPQLLRAAAAVDLVVVLAVGLGLRDREAVAFAVLLGAGLALLRFRSGLLGRMVLGFVFLDVEFWMLTAALSNVTHHGRLLYVLVPVALAVSSAAGFVAAVAVNRWRGGAQAFGAAAVVVFLVAVGVSRLPGVGTGETARAGDVKVAAKDMRFSPRDVDARQGRVTVRMANHDLFWHTFTIDKLDVDVRVPVGGARRVTFTASPGTYTFYCAIPGHRRAGMHGTFTVT